MTVMYRSVTLTDLDHCPLPVQLALDYCKVRGQICLAMLSSALQSWSLATRARG